MSEVGPEAKLSQRKEYYARKIEGSLSRWGVTKETLASPNKFIDFVDDGEIIKKADELLSRKLSTGYNFATFEQFPIDSKESLIFYAVYAERTGHLGELLTRKEVLRIPIQELQQQMN